MGRNLYGQLAHHDTQDRNILSKVEGLPAVRQIAVGQELCVALARNGQVIFSSYNGIQGSGPQT